jgi:hypothetical protein
MSQFPEAFHQMSLSSPTANDSSHFAGLQPLTVAPWNIDAYDEQELHFQ